MKWALAGVGVVAAFIVAAIWGPHRHPSISGFPEDVMEQEDDE